MRKPVPSLVLALALVAGGLGVGAPAARGAEDASAGVSAAGDTATVHLDVDLLATVEEADCDVDVPDGADGIDLLDGALEAGCIDSYRTQSFGGFGEFVTCINGLCGSDGEPQHAAFFWALYVNCQPSSVGASSLSLHEGDTVEFSYEPVATLGTLPLACAAPGVSAP